MEKFDQSYIEMAGVWARNSYCKRRQVGALLVKDRMIISDGYNGTPAGFENICEDENGITVVEVTKPNMAQKGIIKLYKTGEVFSTVTETDGIYQPVYSVKGLPGAEH